MHIPDGQQTLTGDQLRGAFSTFPSGVVALCAVVDGRPHGMSVSSFTPISLDPPLVAVSVARTSSTWPLLTRRPELGMSVLGSDQGELCRRLSARTDDRFGDASWTITPGGAVHLHGAALWLTGRAWSTYDGGDHEIVLLSVTDVRVFPDVEPLLFHRSRFRDLQPAGARTDPNRLPRTQDTEGESDARG